MVNKPIKVGVVGVGHLGQHHVKHYSSIKETDLIGLFDIDTVQARKIAEQYNTSAFSSLTLLLEQVDAVSIVTPTVHHAIIAEKCINAGIHIFIEKPITKTLFEADKLLNSARKMRTMIQVGHIERLNPALCALQAYQIQPKFVEIQRLAPYKTRGTDVPVVLDLMIHDIDILLSLIDSPVKTIRASGLSILTDSVDIAHARIRFDNGTVASMVSSRVAKNKVRKVKLFQRELYATIDLLLGLTEIYRIADKLEDHPKALKTVPFEHNNRQRYIVYDKPPIKDGDALKMELINFTRSLQGEEIPIVSGLDGRNALDVALKIQEIITKDID